MLLGLLSPDQVVKRELVLAEAKVPFDSMVHLRCRDRSQLLLELLILRLDQLHLPLLNILLEYVLYDFVATMAVVIVVLHLPLDALDSDEEPPYLDLQHEPTAVLDQESQDLPQSSLPDCFVDRNRPQSRPLHEVSLDSEDFDLTLGSIWSNSLEVVSPESLDNSCSHVLEHFNSDLLIPSAQVSSRILYSVVGLNSSNPELKEALSLSLLGLLFHPLVLKSPADLPLLEIELVVLHLLLQDVISLQFCVELLLVIDPLVDLPLLADVLLVVRSDVQVSLNEDAELLGIVRISGVLFEACGYP